MPIVVGPGISVGGGIIFTNSPLSLTIATNSDGGLAGWSSTALSAPYSPTLVSTFPTGSTITFQNGNVATITGWDIYAPNYIDLFWDTPQTPYNVLFPITLTV